MLTINARRSFGYNVVLHGIMYDSVASERFRTVTDALADLRDNEKLADAAMRPMGIVQRFRLEMTHGHAPCMRYTVTRNGYTVTILCAVFPNGSERFIANVITR